MINYISSKTIHITPKPEREIPGRQLNLVNSCFEEGQYGAGIHILEQLQSLKLRPPQSVLHTNTLCHPKPLSAVIP
jgi:hypothetical protein